MRSGRNYLMGYVAEGEGEGRESEIMEAKEGRVGRGLLMWSRTDEIQSLQDRNTE
jgi:hypothetical protein